MSAAIILPADCNDCTEETVVNVIGPAGADGSDGTDGAVGPAAYTLTTAGFTVPAVSGNVTITVGNSAWMAPGQVIFIQNAGYYTVSSTPTVNTAIVTNLGYTGNAAPAAVVALGQVVSPSGKKGTDGVAVGVTFNSISPTTTKGDLIGDNGVNSPAASNVRLAVGANNTVLTADSTQATGLIYKVPKLTATASLDFAAFAGLDSQDLTIALVGAAVGDPVTLGCPATIPALLVPFAFVSAADVVTVRLTAVAAVADPAAMSYTVRINKL